MRSYGVVATAASALSPCFVFGQAAVETARFGVMNAIPAFEPRWYPPLVVDPILAKRQDVLTCGSDAHNCLDVNAPGVCCPNSRYCMVNNEGRTQCCTIGSLCQNDTQCLPERFQCNVTRTVTQTPSGGGTPQSTISLSPACCSRACPGTSQYRCPSQMGGGCCNYGLRCASGRQCIAQVTQTPSGFVPQVPEGCTTSQITCPASIGGGCCNLGQSCTRVDNRAVCASATVVPTGEGITPVSQDGDGGRGGLSTGAKAGIAVGVVLGAAVIIGIATWLCIRKRRYGTVSFRSQSVSQIGGGGGPGSYGGPRSRASIPMAAGAAGAGAGSVIMAGSERGGPLSGTASEVRYPTADYFGPDAVPGPYTDLDSPTAATHRDPTPGFDRGVPVEPDGPSHIVAPVELDSGRSVSGKSDVTATPSRLSGMDARALSMYLQHSSPPVPEDADSRFELYGSDTAAPFRGPENLPETDPALYQQEQPQQQEQQQPQQQQQQTQQESEPVSPYETPYETPYSPGDQQVFSPQTQQVFSPQTQQAYSPHEQQAYPAFNQPRNP